MKSYTALLMRKEMKPVLVRRAGCAVSCLVAAALGGAMRLSMGEEPARSVFVITGICLAAFLAAAGSWLIAGDEKRMLKTTLFGRTLTRWGSAEALREEIDREAARMEYECAQFALLPHWLVLYRREYAGRWEKLCALPFPASQVTGLRWERETGDNAGFRVYLAMQDGEYEMTVWQEADIQALLSWSAVQEKRRL